MADGEDEVTAGWLMKKGEGVLAGYKRRYVHSAVENCARLGGVHSAKHHAAAHYRYVVLDNGVMSYYKSIDDYESGQKPLKDNRINISEYNAMPVKNGMNRVICLARCAEITHADCRGHTLRTAPQSEAAWAARVGV